MTVEHVCMVLIGVTQVKHSCVMFTRTRAIYHTCCTCLMTFLHRLPVLLCALQQEQLLIVVKYCSRYFCFNKVRKVEELQGCLSTLSSNNLCTRNQFLLNVQGRIISHIKLREILCYLFDWLPNNIASHHSLPTIRHLGCVGKWQALEIPANRQKEFSLYTCVVLNGFCLMIRCICK